MLCYLTRNKAVEKCSIYVYASFSENNIIKLPYVLVVCREGTLRFCEESSAFLTYEDFKTFTVFLLNLSAVHMDVLSVMFV